MLNGSTTVLRSSRMLGVRALAMHHSKPRLSTYCPSLCIAPSAIFPDYDLVMARLKADREGVYDEEEQAAGEMRDVCNSPEQLPGSTTENEDTNPSPELDSDDGVAEEQEMLADDDEYREPEPEKPLAHHAALDISNTYASRTKKLAVNRKSRRPKPYECRRSGTSSEDETSAPARCTYVSPEDGMQCKKINKTPQEGGRHWRSCHLYKEAKEMLTGALPVGQGTAITSRAQLAEVTPHIQCPFCNALITRSDAMRRHLRTNCKALEDVENDHRGKKGGSRLLAR